YQVNKRQLIQNISEQVRDKKLDGISGLRDESDRNGMRIVIELKKAPTPRSCSTGSSPRRRCRPRSP
ncbi:protein containing DNA topoisomerase, type IIA, subunit A or, partial [human gut metagenome]